jgi:hypothetical protein
MKETRVKQLTTDDHRGYKENIFLPLFRFLRMHKGTDNKIAIKNFFL